MPTTFFGAFSRRKPPLLEARESRAGMQLPASGPRLKAVRPAAAAARPPGANSQRKTNTVEQGIKDRATVKILKLTAATARSGWAKRENRVEEAMTTSNS